MSRPFSEVMQSLDQNISHDKFSRLHSPPRRKSSSRWKKKSRRIVQVPSSSQNSEQNITRWSDDLFLYMMRFVVSENGHVDGDTFRTMSVVCKHWYGLVNASSLWKSKSIDITSTAVEGQLIGYRKLQQVTSLWKHNPTFRVAERATGLIYVVRIVDQTSPETLRHVSFTHELLGPKALLEPPPEMKESLMFPLRMELSVANSKMVLWYDDCEQSFQNWFDTSDRCVNPAIDSDPPTVLPIPLEQLKDWMRQLLKAFLLLENNCLLPNSYAWAKPSNIFMDKDSSRLRILVPSIATRAGSLQQDLYSYVQSWQRSPDLFILGAILSLVARSGKEPPNTPNDETAYVAWLNKEFPALNDSGRAFLRTLVDHELRDQHFPSPRRYTAREALAHPFLSSKSNCPWLEPQCDSITKRKISLDHAVAPERQTLRVFEWAALVDWVIEVCLVFEMSELAAFRAMHYFDRIVAKSSNPFPLGQCQFLAGACLLIASKVTGNATITASDLANCADNSFEADELILYEPLILERLHWQLTSPTSLEFAMAIAESNNSNSRELAVHWCVAVLALQTQLYRKYPASVVGAAASVVARYCTRHPLWNSQTERETGFSLADLQAPVSCLCAEVANIMTDFAADLKAIARSFSVERYGARSIPRMLNLEHYQP